MDEIEKLKRQIKNLEDERAERERYWASLTDEQKVAEALHKRMCHSNHTDGCSFYYDDWKNVETQKWSTKRDWLHRARKLIAIESNIDHLIEILRSL